MRKTIQIISHNGDLYSLCNDGTVWKFWEDEWELIETASIPNHVQPDDNEPTDEEDEEDL